MVYVLYVCNLIFHLSNLVHNFVMVFENHAGISFDYIPSIPRLRNTLHKFC